ncbi:hypothetical protein ZHAS_00012511 [Anopheles sinensis]|uniref:Uncharacterized protein n=1 Tax=Anopheles sinensis TaxID=74873 RepID=A0A084W333_ANOSI|nr:hypothetical protein ZHAS_00012511 [Anopheles sinensis]
MSMPHAVPDLGRLEDSELPRRTALVVLALVQMYSENVTLLSLWRDEAYITEIMSKGVCAPRVDMETDGGERCD